MERVEVEISSPMMARRSAHDPCAVTKPQQILGLVSRSARCSPGFQGTVAYGLQKLAHRAVRQREVAVSASTRSPIWQRWYCPIPQAHAQRCQAAPRRGTGGVAEGIHHIVDGVFVETGECIAACGRHRSSTVGAHVSRSDASA